MLHYLAFSIPAGLFSLQDVCEMIKKLTESFDTKTFLPLQFNLMIKLKKITTKEQFWAIITIRKASKEDFDDLIYLMRTIYDRVGFSKCKEIPDILRRYRINTWKNGEYLMFRKPCECGTFMIMPGTFHFREFPKVCYRCDENTWNSFCISNETCSIYGCKKTHTEGGDMEKPFMIENNIFFLSGGCVECSR